MGQNTTFFSKTSNISKHQQTSANIRHKYRQVIKLNISNYAESSWSWSKLNCRCPILADLCRSLLLSSEVLTASCKLHRAHFMAHNGNHRTIKINTNHKSIKTGFFVGRLLGWDLKSDCRKLHSIGHYKPTNLRAVWSKSENITKRMEAHFTCMPETSQLGWFHTLDTLGTKQNKTKEFIPIHIGRSQEIRWLYLLASFTLGTSSAITEPGFLSIGTITWTGTWSQSTEFKICWNPRFQNFSIGTDSQNPSRTGASAKLSRLCIYTNICIPAPRWKRYPTHRPHHVLQNSEDLLSGLSKSHDVWLPGFMLNWRDKFGFPKLAAHLTLLPVIDEFCLLPLPVRKLAFVWLNARLYEDSAPVAARKHIPVAAVNRVWCTLVISRDLFFVNVCISVWFASGVWMR